jgi:hypothetical protein
VAILAVVIHAVAILAAVAPPRAGRAGRAAVTAIAAATAAEIETVIAGDMARTAARAGPERFHVGEPPTSWQVPYFVVERTGGGRATTGSRTGQVSGNGRVVSWPIRRPAPFREARL